MNYLKLVRANAYLNNFVRTKGQSQLFAIRPISISSPIYQQKQGQEEKSGKKKYVIGALLVGAGALAYAVTKYENGEFTFINPYIWAQEVLGLSTPPTKVDRPMIKAKPDMLDWGLSRNKNTIKHKANCEGKENCECIEKETPKVEAKVADDCAPPPPPPKDDCTPAGGEQAAAGEGAAAPAEEKQKEEKTEKEKAVCEGSECIHNLDKVEEMIQKANSELEKQLKEVKQPAMDATKEALEAYCKAQQVLSMFMDRAYCAIHDDTLDSPGFEELWCTVAEYAKSKDATVSDAQKKGQAAWEALCKLKQLIHNGKTCKYTDCNPLLKTAKEALNCAEYDIVNAKNKMDCILHEAELVDQYQLLVGEFRKGLKAEMESLTGSTDALCRETFSCNECNMILTHAYKKILRVQKELAEAQRTKAVWGLFDESEILQQKKEQLEKDYEKELIKMLSMQNQIYQETFEELRSSLRLEYENKLKKVGDISEAQHLLELRTKYGLATAALSAMEKALLDKKDREQNSDKCRRLWAHCNSLYSSLNFGQSIDEPLKLDKASLLKEYSDNNFVSSLLKTIPEKISTNEQLRERFFNSIDKSCRRMALMKEGDEFSLWKYALGTIQSSLVTKCAGERESLGTVFEILDRTAYFLKKGDLLEAVVVLNNMRGFSRQVCQAWLDDAKKLLEINQTLYAIMLHASANSAY